MGIRPSLKPDMRQGTTMERLDHAISHEWHVAINKFHDGKSGTGEWQHFMYEAKALADEVPRLAMLFKMQREKALPKEHQQCSCCEPEAIAENVLTCCLGTKCAECPMLLALDAAKLEPEQIDMAKAWTCAAHVVSNGGDIAGEGYILTTGDRMYWDRVYENLAATDEMPEGLAGDAGQVGWMGGEFDQ